jgi:hypothetical protein
MVSYNFEMKSITNRKNNYHAWVKQKWQAQALDLLTVDKNVNDLKK